MGLIDKIAAQNRENTKRIMQNAREYLIVNNEAGLSVETTMETSTANRVIQTVVEELIPAIRSAIRDIDPTQGLEFIRMDSRRCEYLLAPEEDFTIVVLQECERHATHHH